MLLLTFAIKISADGRRHNNYRKGYLKMKRIFAILTFMLVILMIGIIGGVEAGQPVTNCLWLIPCGIGVWFCGKRAE